MEGQTDVRMDGRTKWEGLMVEAVVVLMVVAPAVAAVTLVVAAAMAATVVAVLVVQSMKRGLHFKSRGVYS